MRLTIDKLIYGGDGLARIPASGEEQRGKTVFVPYVLAGEEVEAEIVEERKGFSRAELVRVIEAAKARTTPVCEHFGRCGGCDYQHSEYAAQVETKREILRETILRGARLELPEIEAHCAEPYGFRNRTRMKIAIEPEFALGYYRHGSHELEPVRHCPISSPLINRAVDALWELAPEAAKHPTLREVQFFANHDDSELLVELAIHHSSVPKELRPFARALRKRLPEIAGVVVFASGGFAGESDDGGMEAARGRVGETFVEGEASLMYKVGAHSYHVSAGSFFQTNRFLVAKLVELATGNRQGRGALDLYAGAGLFTLPLARSFERVTAVEIAPSSYADLKTNAPAPHIHCVKSTTEEFLKKARGRWEFAIVDPPRAGLGERAAKLLGGLRIDRIVYVSCDPATLARDLAALLAAGYRVEAAQMIDLFPQTYHLETILHLAR